MNMKVLFIGGTGNISTHVSLLALKRGIELTLLNRGTNTPPALSGVETIQADINDSLSVSAALRGRYFDAVVNWIAFKPSDVERDYKLFKDKTSQYIFISSASAYQKPSLNYIITESTPLHNPYWQYSRDKAACEDHLFSLYRTESFPVTVVRPSHTYGGEKVVFPVTGAKTNWTYLKRMLDGKETVVHGDGRSLWTVTHSTDFAKAFAGLLGNFSSIGQAFHITSDEALTWDNIVNINAKILGVPANIIHIPSDFISHMYPEYLGPLIGDKAESLVFDNSKIRSFVPSFICTTPYSLGARLAIEAILSDNAKTEDTAYNQKMDSLISKFKSLYQ